MKKNILLSTLLLSFISFSQNTTVLDQNNVAAKLSTSGIFFQDQQNSVSAYEVPKGGGVSPIFSSAFWFAGLDPNGQLHLSAQRYGAGQDMFNGPISNNYTNAAYLSTYENKLWVVSKTEIQNHITNYQQNGYTIPSSISNWPAHGDASNGEANNLAPFVDYNNNGIYDPINGDYPNIRGNKAVYLIMNDDAGTHTETGGTPLKMEFHFMFYQFNSNNYIDNTTFINVKVINRSQTTYNNFKVAYYVDADIGGSSDDFVGCSPEKNMMFAYNGDNFDDGSGGMTYGANPPAIGIKFLSHNMDIFAPFSNGGFIGDPNTAAQHWGFMNAMWGDSGVPFTDGGNGYGGNVNTNYIYPGNPLDQNSWSESQLNNPSSDRRMAGTTSGTTISPNQSICYDFAVLYNRSSGDAYANASGLYSLADQVQAFFSVQDFNCQSATLNTNETNLIRQEITIYPNPSNGNFNIQLKGQYDVKIFSLTGELLDNFANINSETNMYTSLPRGMYLIQVLQENNIYNKRIIIK